MSAIAGQIIEPYASALMSVAQSKFNRGIR